MDDLEIRYWVIKVPSFLKENADLLDHMKKEIPFFTFHLTKREITTKRVTRMWFTKEQIHTKALDVLIRGNKISLVKEIEEFLIDEFSMLQKEELCYSISDLVEQLNKRNLRVNNSYVSSILKNHFKIESKNSSYKLYKIDYSSNINNQFGIYSESKTGRFYTFFKKDFIK